MPDQAHESGGGQAAHHRAKSYLQAAKGKDDHSPKAGPHAQRKQEGTRIHDHRNDHRFARVMENKSSNDGLKNQESAPSCHLQKPKGTSEAHQR